MYEWAKQNLCGRNITIIVVIAFMLLAGCWFAYCFSQRGVHDNGNGTEPITSELGQVGTAINNAEAGISEAQGHADKVGAGITDAQGQAEYIHSTATTSAELISECQRIIAEVRRRGETQKAKD